MTSCKPVLKILLFAALLSACSFQKPNDHVREYSQANPGFVIFPTTTKVAYVQASNSESWSAKASLNIHVCLGRTFGSTPMEPGVHFEAALAEKPDGADGQFKPFETLWGGCFDYQTDLTFPYAQEKPTYLRKYLVVRGVADELAGLSRSKIIYIDPWDKITLDDWDDSQNGYPQPSALGALQLRVQAVTLRKVGNREVIVKPDLDLRFRYPFQLTFNDRYTRLDNLDASTADSPWPGTHFAITGALLNTSTSQVVAGFKTQAVSDENGLVSPKIALEIPFKDVPLLDSRLQMIIDVTPTSTSGQMPRPVTLTFALDPRIEQVTYQTDKSTTTAHALLQGLSAQVDTTNPGLTLLTDPAPTQTPPPSLRDQLAQLGIENVQEFDLDASTPSLPKNIGLKEAQESLDSDDLSTNFLAQFGDLFSTGPVSFPGQQMVSERFQYLSNPQLFVRSMRFTQAESVISKPLAVKEDSQMLAVNANLLKQSGDNVISGAGNRVGAGHEVVGKQDLGFNAFGNGGGYDWVFSTREDRYAMREITSVSSGFSQNNLANIQNLFTDKLTVNIQGAFRKCLLLEFANALHSHILFCGHGPKTISESYYYVTDQSRIDNFSFVDSRNLQERRLVKLIRGQATFAAFAQALFDHSKTYELVPTSVPSDFPELKGVFDLRLSEFKRTQTSLLKDHLEAFFRASDERGIIDPQQAAVYFYMIASQPAAKLQTESEKADFARMGHILLSAPGANREVYLKVLEDLYLSAKLKRAEQSALFLLSTAKEIAK